MVGFDKTKQEAAMRTRFSTKKMYLEAVTKNPERLAFVPTSLAAELIGVKRSTANDLVKSKKLTKITVHEDGLKWSGIQVKSLLEYISSSEENTESATVKVRRILEKCGKDGHPIEYGVLLEQIGMTHRNPQHRNLIGKILGEISEETWEKYDFMLSALAVNKSTQVPNESFFMLAEQLEAIEDSDDDEECSEFFEQQLEAIYEHYS